MPEMIRIVFDDRAFEQLVKGTPEFPSLPEGGDMTFAFKKKATDGGRPCVVIAWTVQLPDGKHVTAQAVTTLRNFKNVFAAIKGWEQKEGLSP